MPRQGGEAQQQVAAVGGVFKQFAGGWVFQKVDFDKMRKCLAPEIAYQRSFSYLTRARDKQCLPTVGGKKGVDFFCNSALQNVNCGFHWVCPPPLRCSLSVFPTVLYRILSVYATHVAVFLSENALPVRFCVTVKSRAGHAPPLHRTHSKRARRDIMTSCHNSSCFPLLLWYNGIKVITLRVTPFC